MNNIRFALSLRTEQEFIQAENQAWQPQDTGCTGGSLREPTSLLLWPFLCQKMSAIRCC